MGRTIASLRVRLSLLALCFQLRITLSATPEEIEKHLQMGKSLLAQGQYQDALSHYHAAVEGDPSNYMTHFKRATVYLAIGKSKAALPDLEKVIELKPDFLQARIHRGNVLLKQGRRTEAKEEFEELLKINPSNEEATRKLDEIRPAEDDIANAKELKENGDCESALAMLAKPVELSPWDPMLRSLRADCYMMVGKYMEATGDFRSLTKLAADPTVYYFKLSDLQYQLGYLEDALREVRECLKLDPEHKACYPHYKKLKKLSKQLLGAEEAMGEGRHADAVTKLESALKTEPHIYSYVHQAKTKICHCYAEMKDIEGAMTKCNEALEMDENNVDALCDRAEMFILKENFEDAVSDFQKAKNARGDSQKANDGLNRAQKLLKQSQKRDYYKILGVKRTATKPEIIKAYRKLAVQYHPDQYKGDDKQEAEKKFIEIAAAKEVLSDPEKRAKFDAGEDPLDPEAQGGGGGGWPFHAGGFGGQGFQFKFHFN